MGVQVKIAPVTPSIKRVMHTPVGVIGYIRNSSLSHNNGTLVLRIHNAIVSLTDPTKVWTNASFDMEPLPVGSTVLLTQTESL